VLLTQQLGDEEVAARVKQAADDVFAGGRDADWGVDEW
jgi:hypothetical protein